MKKTNKRQTVTTYVPVSDNIYHDGSSYRVRVSINGTKFSHLQKRVNGKLIHPSVWSIIKDKTYSLVLFCYLYIPCV